MVLSDKGLLFLGRWSEYACKNYKMLEIYSQGDREHLADWSPNTAELGKRLMAVGLKVVERVQPELRLDRTCCRRAE